LEKATLKERYDLVMTFESVHDMAYPIEALRRMKDMISANGAVLVGDVKMKDKLEEKNDFVGTLLQFQCIALSSTVHGISKFCSHYCHIFAL
jgi:hypothetical protein